jgi:chromosome partitioning protein
LTVISIATQKGGTGKTTTAHALGAGLILRGHRVLFIDLDPQGNLTYIMRAATGQPTAHEVLTGRATAAEAVQHTPGGDIIPAGPALAGADLELNRTGKEYKLKEAVQPLKESYDYIVIDTPPALGILTINALTAAGSVIIPAQADIFSLQGIGQLYNTIQAVQKYTNPALTIKGILLTRHNARAILSRDITELIEDTARQLDTFVYKAVIREGIALKEAQASRQDIFSYAPRSHATEDYMAFIAELIERSGE